MLDVKEIIDFFKFDKTNIDNWVFKLFYKGTFLLFLFGSAVSILTQYVGDPIHCDFGERWEQLGDQYCWIHSTSKIPSGKCTLFRNKRIAPNLMP